MHYQWHYVLYGSGIQKLKNYLEENYGVSPSQIYYDAQGIDLWSIILDIEETHPHFDEVTTVLANGLVNAGWESNSQNVPILMHFPIYTEEELRSAQWLSMRSSFSKILAENNSELIKIDCIFGTDKWGNASGRHIRFNGVPAVKKPVKWRRNHFASLMGNENQLFCDNLTKRVLAENGICGIDYGPVIHKKTRQPIEDLQQMLSTYTVPNGAIVGLDWTDEYRCEYCGMQMISICDDRYKYGIRNGSIPEYIDFCRTLPLFTHKPYLANGREVVLVSQKLYRVLKENMLDASLWFEPVAMI